MTINSTVLGFCCFSFRDDLTNSQTAGGPIPSYPSREAVLVISRGYTEERRGECERLTRAIAGGPCGSNPLPSPIDPHLPHPTRLPQQHQRTQAPAVPRCIGSSAVINRATLRSGGLSLTSSTSDSDIQDMSFIHNYNLPSISTYSRYIYVNKDIDI